MTQQKISILVPSRGRPDNIRRLYKSLEETTEGKWELLVRIDSDDETMGDYRAIGDWPHLLLVIDERKLLSQLWNELFPYALGDILMHGGDDITFNTKGWDKLVRDAFPEDMVAFVYGDDLSPNAATLGTHGFISTKAAEAVKLFVPPYFASDYNDLWLNEVYEALGRKVYLPEVVTEHHHFAFGKGELDQTHRDRIERHNAENVDQIWLDTAPIRAEWVVKLRKVIDGQKGHNQV